MIWSSRLVLLHGLLIMRTIFRRCRGKMIAADSFLAMELYYLEKDIDEIIQDIDIGAMPGILKSEK